MIKKLQRKFVLIAMTAVFLIMILIIGAINLLNIYTFNEKAQEVINLLLENNGDFPKNIKPPKPNDFKKHPMNAETPFETRYFSVKLNDDDEIIEMDTGHIAAVSSSDAEDYAEEVLELGKKSGFRHTYKYSVQEKSYGKLIVFIDCRQQINSATNLLMISIEIATISFLFLFIIISFFSRRAITPVVESINKQKQFITDASHEIKTPLAIISANSDVLELENGKSEWIDSTRSQVKRLNSLVSSMVTLARLDETSSVLVVDEFSISDLVNQVAEQFLPVMCQHDLLLESDVQNSIDFTGNKESIAQLVSILLENASKYAVPNTIVKLTLQRRGKRIKLSVDNDVMEKIDHVEQLFDRFYRGDSSRSSTTGGYGIGLSIARAIAEQHKGGIVADCSEKSIKFTVSF